MIPWLLIISIAAMPIANILLREPNAGLTPNFAAQILLQLARFVFAIAALLAVCISFARGGGVRDLETKPSRTSADARERVSGFLRPNNVLMIPRVKREARCSPV